MSKIKITNIVVLIVGILFLSYNFIRLTYPVNPTDLNIGNYKLYVIEELDNTYCDPNFEDPNMLQQEIYQNDDSRFYYHYHFVGNGTCFSDLYIWDGLTYHTVKEAVELEYISIEEFTESSICKEEER